MEGKSFLKKVLPVIVLGAMLALATACAPKTLSTTGSAEKGEEAAVGTVTVEWSPESDCATCHTVEEESRADANCVASLHAATNCIDCHSDTDGLAKRHDGVTSEDKMPKKLKKTNVDQEQCLSCHGSYEELAQKTMGYQGLVDEHGTVVNPHALPKSEDHSAIICGDCHKMHSSDGDIAQNALNKCSTCHHHNVFECGTCHSV
ncbi:cytochrome c3 family protein [Adlercreutzia sp. R25]|uniref:cytochrome c3 family protein n=1 Tax=Adlercreutzia shanghongiae TaxID=3111773 RepID=UPI002DBB0AFC|nr:cytochrome c3 family protein [Adlercreutzia sp. R25]MEC4272176.1 cytochrome c3 family protein [Adlercreutzia sp. R25]